uniref:Sugar transporter SWEET n=1 Tax=Corethrella appendiculata TaxID=1370023 RepID=U5ESW2_9DIPT
METFTEILAPHKEIIASVAGTLTVGQMFSGAFVCNDIRKKGSTKDFSVMPFLGGIILSILFMKHALLLNAPEMLIPNLAGIGLSLIYTAFYYLYTPHGEGKSEFWKTSVKGIIFIGVLLAYAEFENAEVVEYRFGMFITFLLIGLIAMPLFSLGEIRRKKSTEGLPFAMILSGTGVSFSWLLYGFSIASEVVVIQNLIAFILSAIQLSLFVIYPSTPSAIKTAKKSKKSN